MINIPKYLIVHHTGGTDTDPLADTSGHTFEIINEWHRLDPKVWLGYYSSLGYAIGYHYFIDKTGKVTQGRADTEIGAHTVGHNAESIGICMAGNFDVTMPTTAQIEALKALIGTKKVQYGISIDNIIPHRHFANKTCYGNKLPDSWARDLLKIPIESPPQIHEEKPITKIITNKMDNQTIGSTSFTFKGINWGKVGAGALVAVAGALLTYITSWITGQDFGAYTSMVMTVWTVIANIARKWFSNIE